MKYLVNFSRVLIGLLFILSGIIKLNDPTGFSYKLDEYFSVFAGDLEAKQDSIYTTISFDNQSITDVNSIRKNDSLYQLTVVQSPWQIDADSQFASTINVLKNGVSIFNHQLKSTDSNFSYGTLISGTKVAGKEIGGNEFAVAGLGETPVTNSFESDIKSYVKEDIWAVGLFNWLRNYALFLSIFVSWLEAILGFAILIGWQPKFTIWMLILITIFFGFLTLYSWVYDKVTDCGCFGDAMPMNPEESFYKNVGIGVFILLLWFGRKHIKPIFSNSFGVKVLTVLTLLMVGFSMYCKHYLPVVDFLHYSEGTDIRAGMKVPEGERASDHIETTYLYKSKTSDETVQVIYDSDKGSFEPKIDYSKWTYVDVVDEKIIEEGYTPPIHDFAFYNADQDNNYIDDFWLKDKKLLLVVHDVKKANIKAIKEVRAIAKQWKEDGNEFWALTASSKDEVEAFRHEHQISEFEFYYGDNTNLKSIIRSSPGLLLITDTSVVKEVWPSTRLPKYKKILRKSE